MRICFTLLFLPFLMLQNCEKQQVDTLEGRWLEGQPVANRIELIFLGENQVVQKTTEDEPSKTFTYELKNDSISLSSNEADVARPIVVFFKMNGDQLQIGNFTSAESYQEIIQLRKVK